MWRRLFFADAAEGDTLALEVDGGRVYACVRWYFSGRRWAHGSNNLHQFVVLPLAVLLTAVAEGVAKLSNTIDDV